MLILIMELLGGIIITKKKLFFIISFITLLSIVSLTEVTTIKAASKINDYIISNKIKPASIQNQEGTFNKWNGYRNGVGHPEGIVVHETSEANVTAQQFTDRFNANWPKLETYVHAFVDNNEILNIHNTDYTVWGAGPTANARYIQVELCRVNSYDAFARSLSNDAYYIASKLIQYNLPDIPGQTVISHAQASNTWHETTHQDPVYYFSTWGYDMDQFNDLIKTYYNNLKTYGDVNGQNDHVIKVRNKNDDFVPLVGINTDNQIVPIEGRALANNSVWYTDQSKTVAGVTYHRVSTHEWVADTYKA
ncbi:peptidoglycan recognition protein family protein [Companilactobacillus zhachilii]|uniref:peptidoglycan recognition protein family protein n=1 Tax=Companilactobacillus zhachilii TaxID=2304606 RepID=UPI00403374AD